MPSTFENQGAIAVRKVMELKLARARESRLAFKLFPITKSNEFKLVFERPGLRLGLQAARGVGGQPGMITHRGFDQYTVDPGVYGDTYPISEQDLTKLREAGKWDSFVNYADHVGEATDYLTQRFLDRAEASIWSMLITGAYSATNRQGATTVHELFTIQQFTPGVLWNVLATAAPLKDLRQFVETAENGVSVKFKAGGIVGRRKTINNILNNTNAADVGGKRVSGGDSVNALKAVNEVLLDNDLPPLVIYDEGYYPEPAGTAFANWLTEGKLVMYGAREDGEAIGEYRCCRHAYQESGADGEWYAIKDERTSVPPAVAVSSGHNGGPVPFYPEALAIINAY